MLYSQGIGPLNRSSTRRAVGFVLRFVDTITVRDSISKDELVSLGIEDVEVTARCGIGHATSRSFNWLSYSERIYF